MLFAEIIQKKRDGGELSRKDIEFFVNGLADASLTAEQVAALAMAIFFRSMTFDETVALTQLMASSGTVIDWSDLDLDGPVVDKHSTGGVGDKVSFLLAPIAAACGCYVPMISGRGLGHTGGTMDKVECIPGYQSAPDFERFKKVVKTTGCAIIGQTEDLAPADRRFYAIRDITATVDSVPLITASILSKKIAAGLEGLVMDVKTGTGAFMPSMEQSRELAKSIIRTANASGLKTHALITDMNEVLGRAAGNALEMAEAVAFLRNEHCEARLEEVVYELCIEMLIVAGLETSRSAAHERAEQALASGRAAEVFSKMAAALGGPADFVERSADYLPAARVQRPVFPTDDGYLSAVDAHAVGIAVIELGGGRRQLSDKLDLAVGFADVATIGSAVGKDRPLAIVHASSEDKAELASELMRSACTVSAVAPTDRPVVYDVLTAE